MLFSAIKKSTCLSVAIAALAMCLVQFVPNVAEADLRMCNKTRDKLSVAIGYRHDSSWVSEGWWNIDAHNCMVLREGPLTSRFVYVYATDGVESGIWGGEGYMCVQNREFTIRGTEDCIARGYERRGFFEVDTQALESWTIQLTEAVGNTNRRFALGGP